VKKSQQNIKKIEHHQVLINKVDDRGQHTKDQCHRGVLKNPKTVPTANSAIIGRYK
jgi:hypothetical protein